MDKTTIAFGIIFIVSILVAIICAIQIIKINSKLKELQWIQILLDQASLTLDNSDLIFKATGKIMDFKQNNLNLDLSLLDDAVELNFKFIDFVNSNAKNLQKFINEYQEEENEKISNRLYKKLFSFSHF